MSKNKQKAFLIIGLTLLLSSCQGGGNGSSTSSANQNDTSETTEHTGKASLALTYDKSLLEIIDEEGKGLKNEYDSGTTIKFQLKILNEDYVNPIVRYNERVIVASKGVYSVSIRKNSVLKAEVSVKKIQVRQNNPSLSVVFVDDKGKKLPDQSGAFPIHSDLHFYFESVSNVNYSSFYDVKVELDGSVQTPVGGIYSLKDIQKNLDLKVDMVPSASPNLNNFIVTNSEDVKASYLEGKGWKIAYTGKGSDFYFSIPQLLMKSKIEAGAKKLAIVFANVFDGASIEGVPTHCQHNIICKTFSADGTELVDDWAVSQGFISMNFAKAGVCVPEEVKNGETVVGYRKTLNLANTSYDWANNDIRIRVTKKDLVTNKDVSAAYISSIDFQN